MPNVKDCQGILDPLTILHLQPSITVEGVRTIDQPTVPCNSNFVSIVDSPDIRTVANSSLKQILQAGVYTNTSSSIILLGHLGATAHCVPLEKETGSLAPSRESGRWRNCSK